MTASRLEVEDEFQRGSFRCMDGIPTIDIWDDYEHISPSIEYILENILYEAEDQTSSDYIDLVTKFNSELVHPCACSGSSGCEDCFHGGNYSPFLRHNGSKELVLKPSRISKGVIYECTKKCECLQTCRNRLLQYGPRKGLLIVNALNATNQYGVITTEFIPKGGFICEYAGEILTTREARRRQQINDACAKMNYILCLNELPLNEEGISIQTIIDPAYKGNIGRYINHSCDPNCEIISVRLDSCIPKIGIFASRNIGTHEALSFDYGDGLENTSSTATKKLRKPCLCGAAKCRGFLPSNEF